MEKGKVEMNLGKGLHVTHFNVRSPMGGHKIDVFRAPNKNEWDPNLHSF